jgi:hypothetical protein
LRPQVTELRDQLAAAKATMAVSAVQSAEEGSEVAELRTKVSRARAPLCEAAQSGRVAAERADCVRAAGHSCGRLGRVRIAEGRAALAAA